MQRGNLGKDNRERLRLELSRGEYDSLRPGLGSIHSTKEINTRWNNWGEGWEALCKKAVSCHKTQGGPESWGPRTVSSSEALVAIYKHG